jgi:MscS family membrane protein
MQPGDFFQQTFLGNTYWAYMLFVSIILAGWILKRAGSKLASRIVYRAFKGFSRNAYLDEFVELLRKPLEVFFALLILYFAFSHLQYPPQLNLDPDHEFGIKMIVTRMFQTLMGLSISWIFLRMVDFIAFVQIERSKLGELRIDAQLISFLKELSKIVLALIALFSILNKVYELNITAIITSLGIGGLAVALAAQETIANLLGSFIIFIDGPFSVGDLVETPDFKGTVESVGFRSTRIRTLDRSLLIVPNKKLVDTFLNNITRSTQRRVKFTIALTYSSREEQLMNVVKEIRQMIDAHPETTDEALVAFSDFKDSNLDITIIYFVNTNDWDIMIRVKEAINLRIMDIVTKNGCSFAFPTSNVYLQSGPAEKPAQPA